MPVRQRLRWELYPFLHPFTHRAYCRANTALPWWRNVFNFTLQDPYRCRHVNRAGVRCFRAWTYDHWCGLHNAICLYHWRDGNQHPTVRREKRDHDELA